MTPTARVNRDGIGAVLSVTPDGGRRLLRPVTGNTTYLSQGEKTLTFGLGTAPSATVEVMWPGGVRNRLYDVRSTERVVIPEIPCSYAAYWPSEGQYDFCVRRALSDLVRTGVIDATRERRLLQSARRAFDDEHHR